MKLIPRIAFRSLWKDKRSSLLTIISIALSLSLISMVFSLGFGALNLINDVTLNSSTQDNVQVDNLTPDQAYQITKALADQIESVYYQESYFVANSDDRDKMVLLTNYSESYKDFCSPKVKCEYILKEGSFPREVGEAIITSKTQSKANLNIGDKIDNAVQTISETESREASFVIVGIIDLDKMPKDLKGFLRSDDELAFYYKDKIDSQSSGIRLKFKPGSKNVLDQVNQEIGKLNTRDAVFVSENIKLNELLGMREVDKASLNTKMIIMGLCSIMATILVLATFSMIHNAVSVLVTNKMEAFGVLRSIGATRKQLKRMMLIESYTLAGLAVLLGIVGGYGLSYGIALIVNSNLLGVFHDLSNGTMMSPYLPLEGIVIVTILSLVIIYHPIHKSFQKIYKMTSVESITRHQKFKVKTITLGDKKPVSRLAKIYATKERSKFRGMKISLVISIVLFITISSFGSILMDSVISPRETEHNVNVSMFSNSYESTKKTLDKYLNYVAKDSTSEVISYSINAYEPTILTLANSNTIPFTKVYAQYTQEVGKALDDEQRGSELWLQYTVVEDSVFESSQLGEYPLLINPNKSEMTSYYSNKDTNEQSEIFYPGGPVYELEDKTSVQFTKTHYKNASVTTEPITLTVMTNYPEGLKRSGENSGEEPALIISESQYKRYFSNIVENVSGAVRVKAENSIEYEAKMANEPLFENDSIYFNSLETSQLLAQAMLKVARQLILIIMIFISGACILNMVNISLINLNKRRSELSVLRSIGMSRNDLNTMMGWESFYSLKGAIVIGTIIALGVLLAFHWVLVSNTKGLFMSDFRVDFFSVITSWLLVIVIILVNSFIIIHETKKFSIIEDIRRI